ncbi:MAG: hypothetical protein IJF92_01130, partial [Bacilli bacterium]|nr:hypothetical protein [Bacilli bacterium]
MKIFKASFKYIFIFTFTLFVLVVFGIYANNWDSLWNYGFSYSIAKGQIPYNDFTMIVQPLYNYIMSIGLILVSHNNIVFLLEQAILVSINFYFLYKVFDYKVWLIIVVMCFPMFIAFSPTYNYFIFFLFTIVLYLEHKNKNDYLIGFILGLIILTKAVVGIFFVIPTSIYYFNDKKKIFKRFIGLIIPC